VEEVKEEEEGELKDEDSDVEEVEEEKASAKAHRRGKDKGATKGGKVSSSVKWVGKPVAELEDGSTVYGKADVGGIRVEPGMSVRNRGGRGGVQDRACGVLSRECGRG